MALSEAAAGLLGSLGSAAVGSGINVAGGLFGKKKAFGYNWRLQQQQYDLNKRLAEEQNRLNRENAEYAYSKELEQWNRENEYNSPAAQMQRYKEAGLNPNIAFTQANTAAGSPGLDIPQAQGYPISGSSGVGDSMPSIQLPNLVHEFMDLKTQKLQQDSIQQGIDLQKAQQKYYDAQSFLQNLKGLQLDAGRPYFGDNWRYDLKGKQMALDIKQQQFENLVFENKELNPLKKLFMQLDANLKSQNYHFNESANPLKLLQMKLQNNIAKNHNIALELDNKYKTDRNTYSANSFLEDLLIKQETSRGKKIANDLDEKIKNLIQTPTGNWSMGDAETFLLNLIRGIVF